MSNEEKEEKEKKDLVYIIKEVKPLWKEKNEKRIRERGDSYIEGMIKKLVDFLLGIILVIGEGFSIEFLYGVPMYYLSGILIYLFLIIDIILIFLFLKKNRIYLVIGIAIGMFGFSVMFEFVYFVFLGPCVYIGAFLYYLYFKYKKNKEISSIRPS
jgi:hypothetical protein